MIALRVGNLFLIAFGLDAAISTLDECLQIAGAGALLAPLRTSLALLVLLSALPMLLLVLASPWAPLPIFLPPVLGGLWLNLGAAPLQLAFDDLQGFSFAASVAQLAIAALAFGLVRRRTGGSWLLRAPTPPVPGFSLRRLLVLGPCALVLTPPLMAAYLVVWALTWAQASTAGFLLFDLQGISLAERRYQREDRQIRLVGMMHIGEPDAYGQLFDSFARESTLVLEEGVRDESQILSSGLSYAKVATRLGLAQQSSVSAYFEETSDGSAWPHVRSPDLDAAELAPETREFIEHAAAVWEASDPKRAILALVAEFQDRPEVIAIVQRDIIERRNERVIAAIDEALPEYRNIVVPWGAIHQPGIEGAVLARGFELTASSENRLVYWDRVWRALRGEGPDR